MLELLKVELMLWNEKQAQQYQETWKKIKEVLTISKIKKIESDRHTSKLNLMLEHLALQLVETEWIRAICSINQRE